MRRKLKVAIATTGRFHVLDLARELIALGHEVAFWSVVPLRRARRFGLPPKAHRALLPWLLPLVLAQRFGGRWVKDRINPLVLDAVDRLIARRLQPCDAFIGMSGLAVKSARIAREKYGAKVFIERGSRHILSQKAILDELQKQEMAADSVPKYAVKRELQGYEFADRIAVPSLHAQQSFIDHSISSEKLFRNPFGVDLSMFAPTPAPSGELPTIIFVGTWSYQKGVDLLQSVWQKLDNVRLIHVGPIGDAPFPQCPQFVHIGAVPQWKLKEFYAQAHVFVLASRQDGFGMVLGQSLACGVPVVCTDRTGGEDLKPLMPDPSWIAVVPHDDVEALADAIQFMLKRSLRLTGKRDLLQEGRDSLTWSEYGKRYSEELYRIIGE